MACCERQLRCRHKILFTFSVSSRHFARGGPTAKKSKLLFGAAVLVALLIYFRPLSFPDLSFEADSDAFTVQKTDVWYDDKGDFQLDHTYYSIQFGSPEAAAIQEILDRYSYRRSVRALFEGVHLLDIATGYWLHLWGPNIDFESSGTGMIEMNRKTYCMDRSGNKKNLAFMEEISSVLAEIEPIETS